MKKALITGITGQDGSYLAEFLLARGYEVHGTVRRIALEDSSQRLSRLTGVLERIVLHPSSIEGIAALIQKLRPDECYHLAAQSFVSFSFEDEFSTLSTNVQGTHLLLSTIKDLCPGCKVYLAGSSEMFGNSPDPVQNESSPCAPVSPYGISKLTGRHLARYYRETHGLFAACGILFNHESPRRGLEFVTRKVTHAVARIKLGLQEKLALGNLEARRDWGYAPDYVEAMWLMLQHDEPDEFVVATGRDDSVRDLARLAFEVVGLDFEDHLVQDPSLQRPVDIACLRGDYSKAKQALGWEPRVSFDQLIELMVRADLERLETGVAGLAPSRSVTRKR